MVVSRIVFYGSDGNDWLSSIKNERRKLIVKVVNSCLVVKLLYRAHVNKHYG